MNDDHALSAMGGVGVVNTAQSADQLSRSGWRSVPWNLRGPLTIVAFVALLYSVAVPKWETNDDVMMAMIAHGYGFIADADPRLLFSSVIWGHLAQAIPSFFGIQGYSWLTIATLTVAAVTYLWVIERRIGSFIVSALFVAVVFVRPLLLPQFTIVSGLATGAGIMALLHTRGSRRRTLLLCVFVTLVSAGFWIRWRECAMILLVFAPILIDRALLRRRSVQVSVAALAFTLALSTYVDDAAYESPQWRTFEAANAARVPYTDNRLGIRLADNAELLKQFGYSTNDLNMISWFFFVDQNQLRPERLNALTASVPPVSDIDFKLRDGLEGLTALADPALAGLVLAIAVLLLLRFNWRVFICASLFLIAIFVLGFTGRPGAIRVYYPVATLLLACALILPGRRIIPIPSAFVWPPLYFFKAGSMVALLMLTCAILYPAAKQNNLLNSYARHDLPFFEGELIYIWGAAMEFDRFYPLWTSPTQPSNLYALGVSSFAPYAVPFQAVGTGEDLYSRLKNGVETPFIGYDHLWAHIDIFCQERFGTHLERTNYKVGMLVQIQKIRCR